MTIYQRLLQYYLDSETYFHYFILMFYSTYEHFGECGTEPFNFESALYRQCSEREQREGGYHVRLSDSQIKQYFSKYTEEQRFAILYAYWFGLNSTQIKNLRIYRKGAWKLLQYYLCNPNRNNVLFSDPNGYSGHYNGIYYISTYHSEFKAFYRDGCLVSEDTGKQYEII